MLEAAALKVHGLLGLLILTILVSGCQDFPHFDGRPAPYPEKTGDGEGPTLWLNYTLVNLGNENRSAYLGPHCGTARPSTEWIRAGEDGWTTRDTYRSVFVEENAYTDLGSKRPFLVVSYRSDPGQGRSFTTTGQEGFPAAFPFTLDPQITSWPDPRPSSTPLTTIDQRDDMVFVDGTEVTLPYEWERANAGNWSAHFTLDDGPTRVSLFRIEGCA